MGTGRQEVEQAIGLAGMTHLSVARWVRSTVFGEAGDRFEKAPALASGGLFKMIGKVPGGTFTHNRPASLVSKEEISTIPGHVAPAGLGAGLLEGSKAAKAISGEQICRLLPARTRTGTHTAASDPRTLIARRDAARISDSPNARGKLSADAISGLHVDADLSRDCSEVGAREPECADFLSATRHRHASATAGTATVFPTVEGHAITAAVAAWSAHDSSTLQGTHMRLRSRSQDWNALPHATQGCLHFS